MINLAMKVGYKKKGIDVSHWQGDIDWKKVKSSGIDFAMIKLGGSDGSKGSYYVDEKFEINCKKAKAAGLSVGTYWFVGAGFITSAEAKKQAEFVLSRIKGKRFDYPIVVDVEATTKSRKSSATVATITFCDVLEEAGYYAMVYASDVSGFKERLDLPRLKRFDKWVARYSSTNSANVTKAPEYVTDYGIWQYTSKGKVDGINGNVDLDYAYTDYSELIKRLGLNDYKGKIQNESRKSLNDVAEEVLRGLWGNGNERKRKLTEAGYVYTVVQEYVNRLLESEMDFEIKK